VTDNGYGWPDNRPMATVGTEINGQRVVLVLPLDVPTDSPEVVEGLRRRWAVAITGECPCGATRGAIAQGVNRAARRKAKGVRKMTSATVMHEHGCPAGDEVLHRLFAAAQS